MKNHIKTGVTLLLLFLFMQLTSACSVIGYYIGKGEDNKNAEIQYSEISTLKPYTQINITLKDGATWYGVFKNVSGDTLYLHNRRPMFMGNIKEVNRVEEHLQGRVIGLGIGAALDILVIYAIYSASMGSIGEAVH